MHEAEIPRRPETRKKPLYPWSPRVDTQKDFHGTLVPDPYIDLEGDNNQVVDWTNKQNQFTRKHLDKVPERDSIRKELVPLMNRKIRLGLEGPITEKDIFFQHIKKEGQNHFAIYKKTSENDEGKVVLDPNTFSEDGTKVVNWTRASRNAEFLAYGVSEGGTEETVLEIINMNTGENLADKIPNTRAASLAWLPKDKGFYYTRYQDKGSVPEGEEKYRRVYLHKIGDDYKEDQLLFTPKYDTDWPSMLMSEDGKWVNLNVYHGGGKNDLFIARINEDHPEKLERKPVFVDKDGAMGAIVFKNTLYMQTNYKASDSKIMTVSLNEHDLSDMSKWEELVPEKTGVTLQGFKIIGGKMFITYLDKAYSRMDILNLETKKGDTVKLPETGIISSYSGRQEGTKMYFGITSYTSPLSIYKMDVNTLDLTLIEQSKIPEDIPDIVFEQVTYELKDGKKTTMFIVHRKDLEKNGENPTLIYTYGGFGDNMTLDFSASIIPWVKKGRIYVAPNLPGGAEYGEDWHRQGMLENKQNVFDALYAATEHLISEGFTKKGMVVIWGKSNGGLLMGAGITQRPDLFGAVVSEVGLFDMVKFPEKGKGDKWLKEFGNPNNPEHFNYLYKYSPYHNVKEGTQYPSVLLITRAGDTRVHPMHSKKMAAMLQYATSSHNPILFYEAPKTGHLAPPRQRE
jgi:prolyl oligopeptidase